jgi:hypothetical protein
LLAHLDTHQGQAEIAAMARAEAARLTAIEAEDGATKTAKHMDNVVTEPCDGPDFSVTEPCDGPDEGLTVSYTAPTEKPARTPYKRPRSPREEPWVTEMRQELDRLERGLIS